MMILEELNTSLRTLAVMSALTGLAYPLAVTAVAQLVSPGPANGSLLLKGGKPVGSRLIGQPFDDPRLFWSRPSATTPAYNASSSSGSNLGPSNPDLIKAVKARVDALRAADPGNAAPVPVDLVTASASGLDPHISPAAAAYQAPRVARLRGLSKDAVHALIAKHTQGRFLGLLGEPVVNVLELNLDLENIR